MQILSASMQAINSYTQNKKNFEADTVKPDMSLNARYAATVFNSSENSSANALAQSSLFNMVSNNQEMHDFLMGIGQAGSFSLSDLGYTGKPILELNPDEASALLSNGGFFSVENTAARAADFVIAGGGEDISRLKAGREGIVNGFEQAERAWGGKLPDIAYESQKLALEKIDERIQSLGGSVLDLAV